MPAEKSPAESENAWVVAAAKPVVIALATALEVSLAGARSLEVTAAEDGAAEVKVPEVQAWAAVVKSARVAAVDWVLVRAMALRVAAPVGVLVASKVVVPKVAAW